MLQKICGRCYCIFEKPEHLQQFTEYMNKQHPDIRFSVEAEKNYVLPFLDINPFVPKAVFLYPLKTPENLTVF